MQRQTWASALALALVATGCWAAETGGDQGSRGASDSGDPYAGGPEVEAAIRERQALLADERDEVLLLSVDPADRCDLGFNTVKFNEAAPLVQRLNRRAPAPEAGEVDLDMLDPDSWVPLTDPDQCEALADELQQARDAAARFPTVADALAAGYTPGSAFVPGEGAQFTNVDLVDVFFDPGRPEVLLYAGMETASELVGLGYLLDDPDGVPDEGFAGWSDRWHRRAGNWTIHAWLVPGCESPMGVFSRANPRVPSLPPDGSLDAGCDTGRTVLQPLQLDQAGDGPRLE